MKKNKMMRIASVLLIAALLSTSVISGTFAKYVTTKSISDTARVAKFGVNITADGSLFEEKYDIGVTDAQTTVLSASSDDVVAPGTKNETGLTFSISGDPEVDVHIDFVMDADSYDVCLPAGTYNNLTGIGESTFTVAADGYHPLKFYLKKDGTVVTGCNGVPLSAIREYLNTTFSGGTMSTIHASNDSGASLANAFGTYTLTWEWPFSVNDAADTFLGQYAADSSIELPTGVSASDIKLGASVTISITVTQVD